MVSRDTLINGEVYKVIPYGYCRCGCGEKTNIAPYSNITNGSKKGEHYRYIHGHNSRNNSRLTEFVCVYCGEKYVTKNNGENKYCSGKCRMRYARKYNENYIKYIKSYLKVYQKKYSRLKTFELMDSYVRNNVIAGTCSLKAADIHQEIIEVYREYLKLLRMVRKTKLKGEQYVKHEGTERSIISSSGEVADG